MRNSALLDTSNSIIMDTCVLADALFKDRPRHITAIQLCQHLKSLRRRVLLPAHSFFELASVVFSEFHKRKMPLHLGEFQKQLPVEIDIVDINLNFIETHLTAAIADRADLDSSGGDMIFLALALGQDCPLVTEDGKLMDKAKAIGIKVFNAKEYILAFPA